MSAATDNAAADPLSIFGDVNPNNQEPSESSQVSNNPFDPLGGSQSSKHDDAAPLDLMSQISSWGAQNHHQEQGATTKPDDDEQAAPAAPKANVMSTASNAITLSDDLVAEAHAEFEATEDKLRKFEQEQSGPTAQ